MQLRERNPGKILTPLYMAYPVFANVRQQSAKIEQMLRISPAALKRAVRLTDNGR